MIEMKLSLLEKRLGKKLDKNATSVGLDTASRSGWCRIHCDNEKDIAYVDYGFINVESKDIYFKYDELINIFQGLINTWKCGIVIEDVFFGRNVNTLKMLTRIGMICYVLARLGPYKTKFILASTARAKLGFNGTAKKEIVHEQIRKKLKFKMDDIDIVDAFVLALVGLLKEEKLF